MVKLPWWPLGGLPHVWARRPDVVADVLARDATPQALAERLRRELVGYEARLTEAAAALEAARQEETDAELALLGREVAPEGEGLENFQTPLGAARKRLQYATRGRELAWLAFHLAKARVNLHAGVLHQLEKEQTEAAPPTADFSEVVVKCEVGLRICNICRRNATMPTAAELNIIIEAQDRASVHLRAIGGDVQRLERQVESASSAFGGLGGMLGKLGGIGLAAGGVGAIVSGVQGAIGAMGSLVTQASDLNEQVSRSDQIFGAAAQSVQRFARESAQSLGIARTEALEMAGNFGQLLRTSGLTEDAAADMSQQLLRLGADLASFNNLEVGDALDKLRSGLTGEAEPLRSLGVLLSEDAVQLKALAAGPGRDDAGAHRGGQGAGPLRPDPAADRGASRATSPAPAPAWPTPCASSAPPGRTSPPSWGRPSCPSWPGRPPSWPSSCPAALVLAERATGGPGPGPGRPVLRGLAGGPGPGRGPGGAGGRSGLGPAAGHLEARPSWRGCRR